MLFALKLSFFSILSVQCLSLKRDCSLKWEMFLHYPNSVSNPIKGAMLNRFMYRRRRRIYQHNKDDFLFKF